MQSITLDELQIDGWVHFKDDRGRKFSAIKKSAERYSVLMIHPGMRIEDGARSYRNITLREESGTITATKKFLWFTRKVFEAHSVEYYR